VRMLMPLGQLLSGNPLHFVDAPPVNCRSNARSVEGTPAACPGAGLYGIDPAGVGGGVGRGGVGGVGGVGSGGGVGGAGVGLGPFSLMGIANARTPMP
jgi:hypothetical protein